jgi:hypothetical protein
LRWGRAAALLLAISAAGTAPGCAWVTAQPVKPGDRINGIRIYDVKPLLVVSDTVTIQLVPNYNRAYALRFGAFLAKNHFQASMSNGVLTNVNANLDSTEFIKVLTALIEKLPVPGEGFSGSAPPAAKGGIQNRFQVYEIVFDDDGNLVGLRPLLHDAQLLKVRTTAPTAAQGFSGGNVIIQQQPQPGQPFVVPQPDATPQPSPATGAG